MTKPLGTLVRLDVREAWAHEAQDFTPWLASEAGIKLLGEAIGIEMVPQAQEQPVGPYRADIVAKRTDTPDESFVLIENQLAKTDHTHLGQLLTYAAGLKAATVVWVAATVTEEHRAALDWLNEITPAHFGFFGLEIELWRIGTSPPAPKFNVVVRPNDFVKGPIEEVAPGAGKLPQMQQRYWNGLRDLLLARKSPVRPQKALPLAWTNFALGRTGAWLTASMNTHANVISVECALRGPPNKVWFDTLEAKKADVEKAIPAGLSWERLPNRKMSRIAISRKEDPTNEAGWAQQHQWLAENLETFKKVFGPLVKELPDEDEVPPDEAPPEAEEPA